MRTPQRTRVERRLEHLRTTSREAGLKLTHQRLEILRELAASEDHPTAEVLFRKVRRRVPTVSLDTVYRTLWALHDLGLVSRLGSGSDAVRFDANLDPHHHFVCLRCGLVRDFEGPALDGLRIPEAVGPLGSVVDAHVEVRGRCAACQRKPGVATRAPASSSTRRSVTS